jgi:uncharacterized membrane protein
MKKFKKVLLYLLVVFYVGSGLMHFVSAEQYYFMMPSWLPFHDLLIYLSGLAEIGLGLLLIPTQTRAFAAKLIVVMLLVFFFVIHIPQSIDFYQTNNEFFLASIIRLPIQFLFIAWAWLFAKKETVQ